MKEKESTHRFAEFAVRVAGYGTNPSNLKPLLREFQRGEFIIINGRGLNSTVMYGMADEIRVLEEKDKKTTLYRKSVIIYSKQLYKQVIDLEEVDPNDPDKKWEELQPPQEGILFNFDWFKYRKKHQRLKLELEESGQRCWLCSRENPVYLDRFRWMILTMCHQEYNQKLPSLKKFRKLAFTGHF